MSDHNSGTPEPILIGELMRATGMFLARFRVGSRKIANIVIYDLVRVNGGSNYE